MHELKLKGLRHGGGSHRRNFDPLPRGALSRPCKLAVERSCQPMSANVFNHIWTSAVFAHGSSAHTTAVDMWMNDTGNLNLQGDTAQRPNQTETRKLRRRRFWPAGGLWDLRRFGAIWGDFRGRKWPVYRRPMDNTTALTSYPVAACASPKSPFPIAQQVAKCETSRPTRQPKR